jgi:hypothetical protein
MKALFKYNGGRGALLCSKCKVILKTGDQFTEEEWEAAKGHRHIDPKICKRCEIVDICNTNGVIWTEARFATIPNDPEMYRKVTITLPCPQEILEMCSDLKMIGWAKADGKSGIDIYIPL